MNKYDKLTRIYEICEDQMQSMSGSKNPAWDECSMLLNELIREEQKPVICYECHNWSQCGETQFGKCEDEKGKFITHGNQECVIKILGRRMEIK